MGAKERARSGGKNAQQLNSTGVHVGSHQLHQTLDQSADRAASDEDGEAEFNFDEPVAKTSAECTGERADQGPEPDKIDKAVSDESAKRIRANREAALARLAEKKALAASSGAVPLGSP